MHNDDGVENALENKKLFIFFVLDEELFCLKDVFVEVDVVDVKIPIIFTVLTLDQTNGFFTVLFPN